jgi:hypothetical protein
LLHLEGIGGLSEEISGLLVLLLSSTKEAEATSGTLKLLLSLKVATCQHNCKATNSQCRAGEGLRNLLEKSSWVLSHGCDIA